MINNIEIRQALSQMIRISEDELNAYLALCHSAVFKKGELLNKPGIVPPQVFFMIKGIVRVMVTDRDGQEHTTHFALENQFIADYTNFILQQPSFYTIEALEPTEVVVMPRKAVEWGYDNLQEGQKLGRLIAEYYFIYHDNRIKNLYTRTPKERYDSITDVFPNIHNRVPQHMIASFLGITPIHLSRLKKAKT